MRTLVVNLTRFGDLLQTQPVFTGLKRAGHEVGLVCLRNFLPAAGLVRHLDAVFAVPGESFLAELDQAWPLALGHCLTWTQEVQKTFAPDRVINLTPSLPGRLLARALGGGSVLGFGLDDFGYGGYSTPWAAFLEATSRHRGTSPFNLVDLFFKAAHLGDAPREYRLAEPSEADVAAMRARIKARAGVSFKGLAGLQLGASAPLRQWPARSFANAAAFLWERHGLLPVLLGSKGEEHLAGAFRAAADIPHVDLVGETDLSGLAAAVRQLKVLVTNDTGTMHLAAGLGTPILAIFLATAQPWDTGPYLPGACCLEPDMECHPCAFSHQCQIDGACRDTVGVEAVTACLDGYLSSGMWPEVFGLGVRAWECVSGPDGFLDLRSLSGHGRGPRAAWNAIQRDAWRRFLDGQSPQALEGAGELPDDFKRRVGEVLSQAAGLLNLLTTQAQVLQAAPRPPMRAKFMANWQRLETLFTSDPALCALGHVWMHLSQAESQDMSTFTHFAAQVSGLVASLSASLSPRP